MAEEKIKTEAAISEPQRLNLESRISNLEGKFEIFIGEMRDRDNQRAEDMREIRSKLDSIGNHIRNITVAAIFGIAAISVSVVGFVISAILR